MTKATRTKMNRLVVLIPTRDRPAYLNLTVESVLEQAKRHGHKDVEVVVSDVSSQENARKNEEFMKKLGKRFPGTPIHYYPPGEAEPIKKLLEDASPEEKKALELLVPRDGHYGAHRNRLTLLGIYHGGSNTAYLHLDDDTPLMSVNNKTGTLAKNPDDVLGAFKAGFQDATQHGKAGFSGRITGVADATVSISRGSRPTELRKYLKVRRSISYPGGLGLAGPGRILGPAAVRVPYVPYGRDEDWRHYHAVSELLKFNAPRERGINFKPLSEQRREAESAYRVPLEGTAAAVVHIGIHGPRLPSEKTWFRYEISQKLQGNWMKLADRMMNMRKRLE